MISGTKSEEELKFLEDYTIEQYERPSVTSDIAVFSVIKRMEDNIRKLPKGKLKVLLIQRASFPYKSFWALPGGFCLPEEDAYTTAKRELYEETTVQNAYLNLFDTFGEKGRDPRGWILSYGFLALIDGNLCELRAGSDAREARWFSIELEKIEVYREQKADSLEIKNSYVITLSDDDITISVIVEEQVVLNSLYKDFSYKVVQNDKLAFDHGIILVRALLYLRKLVENDGTILFDFLPEKFTLTELQHLYEIIIDNNIDTKNFRRKFSKFVIETDELVTGRCHRPAKLYKRNLESFY